MELLKQCSEDIPEVGLEIVLTSAEIEDLVRKLDESTERALLLNFKYIYSCYMELQQSYSVSQVLECYRMSRPVFKLVTIVIV